GSFGADHSHGPGTIPFPSPSKPPPVHGTQVERQENAISVPSGDHVGCAHCHSSSVVSWRLPEPSALIRKICCCLPPPYRGPVLFVSVIGKPPNAIWLP